jgi:predicted nuclease with TOPRIM domain
MRAMEATAPRSPRLDATEAELGRLRACIDDLRSNSRKLEERLGKRDEQLQKLRTRIGKLKAKAKLSRT